MTIRLSVLYEDDEVVIMKAPHDDELVDLVYEFIRKKGRPVTWKELRETFSGIAGEDRLRKALHQLREKGLVVSLRGGRYATPDMPGVQEEIKEAERRRILREAIGAEIAAQHRRRKRKAQAADSVVVHQATN